MGLSILKLNLLKYNYLRFKYSGTDLYPFALTGCSENNFEVLTGILFIGEIIHSSDTLSNGSTLEKIKFAKN